MINKQILSRFKVYTDDWAAHFKPHLIPSEESTQNDPNKI